VSPEGTDFLYPFIEGDERDAGSLLTDLASSARAKAADSARLRTVTLERARPDIDRAAVAIAERVADGARLYTFGNGGSATDAAGLAALFCHPPWGRSLPARSLVADEAVLTALGNDVGFDLVFSRQLIAHARAGDVAIGLSTSGSSSNLLTAFAEAGRRGLVTVGIAGYDGGRMAVAGLDHCLVVSADSVHRIQETEAAVLFALWSAVQQQLETPQ
jgi:D-sedoheptulose 7-phosphate isomerase